MRRKHREGVAPDARPQSAGSPTEAVTKIQDPIPTTTTYAIAPAAFEPESRVQDSGTAPRHRTRLKPSRYSHLRCLATGSGGGSRVRLRARGLGGRWARAEVASRVGAEIRIGRRCGAAGMAECPLVVERTPGCFSAQPQPLARAGTRRMVPSRIPLRHSPQRNARRGAAVGESEDEGATAKGLAREPASRGQVHRSDRRKSPTCSTWNSYSSGSTTTTFLNPSPTEYVRTPPSASATLWITRLSEGSNIFERAASP